MTLATILLAVAAAAPSGRLATPPHEVPEPRKGPAAIPAPVDRVREALQAEKREQMIEELTRIANAAPPGDEKAELQFQLAELWWEKARAQSLVEVKEFDGTWAKWLEKREGPEPKADTRRSDASRAQALALYETVLREHPGYPRTDEVLFVAGLNQDEAGRKDAAVRSYETLIRTHPDSRLVPDAWVQLGEHWFQANDLGQAKLAFGKAAAFRLPKLYPFALYKLAWCDYNAGAYAAALTKLQEVVAYSDAQARTSAEGTGDRIQLAGEALKDMVLSYARLDAIEPAVDYFDRRGGEVAVDLINRLAAQYFDEGKFEQSIRVYRLLQAQAKDHVRAPSWEQRILLAYDKLNRRDQVAGEMKRLVADYGPRSAWAKRHEGQKSAVAEASELAETALRELVQDYHHEAIKTKSVATYRLARDIYRQYLEQFPRSESAYAMRFYLAEIEYSLEEWDEAAATYEAVVDADPRGSYAVKAAYDAILALEKSVAVSRGTLKKRELAGDAKVDDRGARGEVDAAKPAPQRVTKDASEEPIPANEQALVDACGKYVSVAQGAKDEIAVRYKAAFLLYEHRHFSEAAKRFGEIILRWPTDAWSRKAADLSLDILNTKEEWLELSGLAHRFLADERLAPAGSDFRKRVALVEEGARFKYAMEVYEKKKDLPRAAKEFKAFVAAWPRSEYAPKALYDALVIADQADELDVELAAGRQLLSDYPSAEPAIVKLTLPALASAALRTGRFADAIRWYEEAAERWPDDEHAPDWLYDASLLREDSGDDAGALAGWRRYLKRYGSRPDVARIAFDVGLLLERQKDLPAAARAFREFQRDYARLAKPGQLVLARYEEALATQDPGALADVVAKFQALPEQEKAGPVADAAAHARFLLAQPQDDGFRKLRFESTRQRELVATLKAKNARLEKLLEAYAEVVRLGSARWTEAAFERLGEAYREFNKDLLDAPTPRGLDAEQQELYRSTLESQALPLEDKAVEAFRSAVEAAQKSGVYGEGARKAQDRLRELQPDSFGEVHEAALVEVEPALPASPPQLQR